MTIGQSVVAFYGTAGLGNRYLGRGVYLDYIGLDQPEGQQLLKTHPLYGPPHSIPDNAKAFIKLRNFQLAQHGEGIESLNGRIEASNLTLTLANLPASPAKAKVYYRPAEATK
jgi:hypothetical protein